jgi:hypothetical protein
MNPVWFSRFADIPGIRYATPAGLDLSKLRRRDAVPEINRFDGSASLWWETRDGGSTRSPAGDHALGDLRGESVDRIRSNLAEILELPGEPSDYHFALQSAAEALYSRRRQDAFVLDEVEGLLLLDLQLIQAIPATITYDRDGQTGYFVVSAFNRLARMYLTEGRVRDAAWVESIAERFGNAERSPARDRAAAMLAEDTS